LKTKDAAIAQLRETIRERDSALFDLGHPQQPTPLIDELLQSSQTAVDKFRDLVLLHRRRKNGYLLKTRQLGPFQIVTRNPRFPISDSVPQIANFTPQKCQSGPATPD